jgi:cytochrome c peroxidase
MTRRRPSPFHPARDAGSPTFLLAVHSVLLSSLVLLTGCGPRPEGAPSSKDGATGTGPAGERGSAAPSSVLPELPLGLDAFEEKIPEDNPLTHEKVVLGKHLYFDTRLSKDGTVACATCHDPAKGWSDARRTSAGIGGQTGNRNAPTIINRRFSMLQFWDGRAKSLEDQALGPVQNPIEMGNTLEGMVAALKKVAGYAPLFAAAFGDPEITPERVAKAIASFERTVLSGNSAYDRYQAGDKTALSDSAVRGKDIFLDNNKGRCGICHSGFNFTDEKYHNIGVGMDDPEWEKNHIGRYAVTQKEEEKGAYKTPTLRQLTESGPYMHDGSQATLTEVVEFYVKGGHKNPYLDKEMRPLTLSDQEKRDLVEFLSALSGDVTKVERPARLE